MKEITDVKINELLYCTHCQTLYQTTFGERMATNGGSSSSNNGSSKISYGEFQCPKCKKKIRSEIDTINHPDGWRKISVSFTT